MPIGNQEWVKQMVMAQAVGKLIVLDKQLMVVISVEKLQVFTRAKTCI